MITFEEAKEKAKELIPSADRYTDQSKCYTFSDSSHENDIGGDGCPLVIVKETGECTNLLWALHNNLLDEDSVLLPF